MASPPSAAIDPDEERLLDRARGGDREAFEQLVEAHLPRVWRVVWRIVRHHEDCEGRRAGSLSLRLAGAPRVPRRGALLDRGCTRSR
jgi:hypothetical protein